MKRRIPHVVLVGLLLLVAAKSPKAWRYLSESDVDVKALLPAPPAGNSEQQAAELAFVKSLQRDRTAADVERIRSEAGFDVFAFSTVLGTNFTPAKCPQAEQLFKGVETDATNFDRVAKGMWNRPRPKSIDSSIQPALVVDMESSYPSGHATRAMAYAEILAEIFPARRAELEDRARQIGWDRVIAGAHYPSDVYGGEVLGKAVAERLLEKKDFLDAMEKVRGELKPLDAAAH